MIKPMKAFLLLAAATLLVNCVNVDMETTLHADRTGKGKLVYSWDPSNDMDHLSIDENYTMIESNPTITVTAKREYDSEGTHFKEIEWTFKDINKVDLEGLSFFFRQEGDTMILQALFEEEDPGPATQETGNAPDSPAQTSTLLTTPGAVSQDSGPAASLAVPPAPGAADSNPGQGTQPDTVSTDDEESQEMDEMLTAMIRAALDGFRIKFQFNLPYPVVEAPGATVNGRIATWEIPLKEVMDPNSGDNYDQFLMVMKAP